MVERIPGRLSRSIKEFAKKVSRNYVRARFIDPQGQVLVEILAKDHEAFLEGMGAAGRYVSDSFPDSKGQVYYERIRGVKLPVGGYLVTEMEDLGVNPDGFERAEAILKHFN